MKWEMLWHFFPGTENRQTILLTAHADVPFAASVDHNCTVDDGKVHGPGVADNSLGLAILATLPTILERLDIRLKSKLLFLKCYPQLKPRKPVRYTFFPHQFQTAGSRRHCH